MTAEERSEKILGYYAMPLGTNLKADIADEIRNAVEEEREACAEVALNHARGYLDVGQASTCIYVAADIRARKDNAK